MSFFVVPLPALFCCELLSTPARTFFILAGVVGVFLLPFLPVAPLLALFMMSCIDLALEPCWLLASSRFCLLPESTQGKPSTCFRSRLECVGQFRTTPKLVRSEAPGASLVCCAWRFPGASLLILSVVMLSPVLARFDLRRFDGSGAENDYDAGSCVDGRLTSAWNWCSKVSKEGLSVGNVKAAGRATTRALFPPQGQPATGGHRLSYSFKAGTRRLARRLVADFLTQRPTVCMSLPLLRSVSGTWFGSATVFEVFPCVSVANFHCVGAVDMVR